MLDICYSNVNSGLCNPDVVVCFSKKLSMVVPGNTSQLFAGFTVKTFMTSTRDPLAWLQLTGVAPQLKHGHHQIPCVSVT